MSQIPRNLLQYWNRYTAVLLAVGLMILKNFEVLSADDVTYIQTLAVLVGVLPPSQPPKTPRGPRRMGVVRPLSGLVLLFLLSQCRPKPDPAQVTRDQVRQKLDQVHEKTVAYVDSLPDSGVDSLLSNDTRLDSLFIRFSR